MRHQKTTNELSQRERLRRLRRRRVSSTRGRSTLRPYAGPAVIKESPTQSAGALLTCALVALLTLNTGLYAQQTQKANQAQTPANSSEVAGTSGPVQPADWQRKVIKVKHADLGGLARVLETWGPSIRISRELGLLTVVGPSDAVAKVEEAVRDLDVPQTESDLVRTFYLTSLSTAEELQEVATSIRGLTDIRRLFILNSQKAFLARGTPAQIAIAEAVISEINKTPSAAVPQNVEITAYVLGASDTDETFPPPPDKLEGVVSQLKRQFPYQGYRLLETMAMRTRIGQGSKISGLLPVPDVAPGIRQPAPYEFQLDAAGVSTREEGRVIQLKKLRFGGRIPVPTGPPETGEFTYSDYEISTEMDVREGDTVVVGKAGAYGSIRGLFLVLTARVAE